MPTGMCSALLGAKFDEPGAERAIGRRRRKYEVRAQSPGLSLVFDSLAHTGHVVALGVGAGDA
jgi:hypothetical protein